ncbi:MAG: BadF/BadG/BcrA/BcrD ATPase family protein, partial [Planctomycetota bacterium]
MKVYLGVDLGSSGTKAVLLDSEGRWLGAGRVPTGADYGEALESARRAARREARVELLRRTWSRGEAQILPILKSFREAIAREMGWRFREDVLRRLAEAVGGRARAGKEALGEEALGEGWRGMEAGGIPAYGLRGILERIREAAVRMAPRWGVPAAELVGRVEEAARAAERALYRADLEDLLEQAAERVRVRLRGKAREGWERAWRQVAGLPLDEVRRGVTGYGRHVNAWAKAEVCSELVCHARGARWLFPGTSTVL